MKQNRLGQVDIRKMLHISYESYNTYRNITMCILKIFIPLCHALLIYFKYAYSNKSEITV